ncbi:MAG: hypothetical protein GZ086_01335 [Gelidibacter sp.]|nr:hypothetical protein [Gelidibacter sp.]
MKEETYVNLGKSLHVFNEIELFISLIITHNIEPKDKPFFLDYILNPKVVDFGAKLKILINLNIFDKTQIKKIRDLSTNRNVFAHSNRTESVEVDDDITNSNTIKILVSDVIFKTNSDGKLTKMSYSNFIKEHIELQNEIIDFIYEYIIANKIDTHYNHIENLKLFKS